MSVEVEFALVEPKVVGVNGNAANVPGANKEEVAKAVGVAVEPVRLPMMVLAPIVGNCESERAFEPIENELVPAEYVQVMPEPHELVEVLCQVGTPPTSARTWPFVPCDVVASAPEPLPRSSVFACMLPHPVPPFGVVRAVESVSAPVEENEEVAVPPKKAVVAESWVVEACCMENRDGIERVTAPVEAEAVI